MRIAVVANAGGSGKTTLARRLAALLDLPCVELDALFHGPGWTASPDFEARVAEAVAEPGWVIDGNYFNRGADAVLAASDLVVWLDVPLAVCLWRLALRTARRYATREQLWNGNREGLRQAVLAPDGLFRYAIAVHGLRRREFPERLAGLNYVRLRGSRGVESLVGELTAQLVSAGRAGRPPAA